MSINKAQRKSLLWLLASLMLVMRVGDVHLHLCFDGREPPATVHALDAEQEHVNDGTLGSHQDVDVDEPSSHYKAADAGFDLLPACFLVLVYRIAPADTQLELPPANPLPPHTDPLQLLPPSRGPPATLS
ncbi:MAG: hypothetical protein WDO12_03120 [Pseudomonadota bacterium]